MSALSVVFTSLCVRIQTAFIEFRDTNNAIDTDVTNAEVHARVCYSNKHINMHGKFYTASGVLVAIMNEICNCSILLTIYRCLNIANIEPHGRLTQYSKMVCSSPVTTRIELNLKKCI